MTEKIRPDAEDFTAAERDYCAKYGITPVVLKEKAATNDVVAADLYRLAQANKFIRMVEQQTLI
jgi:hypothetical protein